MPYVVNTLVPKHKRKSFPQWYRLQIAAEQDWKCNACKQKLPAVFDIDHIVSLYHGGNNERENLQCLCVVCHAVKSRSERYAVNKTSNQENQNETKTDKQKITTIQAMCPKCQFKGDSRFIAFHRCIQVE